MIKNENENKNCFHSGLVSTGSSSAISVPANQRKSWYIDYENSEKKLAIVYGLDEPKVSIQCDCGQYVLSGNQKFKRQRHKISGSIYSSLFHKSFVISVQFPQSKS
jgi:hypothetical protein